MPYDSSRLTMGSFMITLTHWQCCILTFDPAKHAIPKWCTGRKWHIPMAIMRRNRVGGLAEIWDKVKIPWYTHRLMHRRRVTCELHDSYFRLMTSKHAIPKIEWAIELLYNSVKTGSQWVGAKCGRESHHPAEGALGTPDWVWRPDQLERRCWNENMSQRDWTPRPLVEQ